MNSILNRFGDQLFELETGSKYLSEYWGSYLLVEPDAGFFLTNFFAASSFRFTA
jgi:hypothetical protein